MDVMDKMDGMDEIAVRDMELLKYQIDAFVQGKRGKGE